jgi:hypothetical protein
MSRYKHATCEIYLRPGELCGKPASITLYDHTDGVTVVRCAEHAIDFLFAQASVCCGQLEAEVSDDAT